MLFDPVRLANAQRIVAGEINGNRFFWCFETWEAVFQEKKIDLFSLKLKVSFHIEIKGRRNIIQVCLKK